MAEQKSFKIKAWLDLSERRENGEHIDSKNIKKHKNDIMRLGASIEKGQQLQISGRVREDVEIFMDKVKNEPIDLKNLNLRTQLFQRKRCHICQRKHTCPFHEINIFGEQSSLSAETVALHKYIIRRPAVEVTEENAYVLQLLDCLKEI